MIALAIAPLFLLAACVKEVSLDTPSGRSADGESSGASPADDEIREISARGFGNTLEQARKDCMRAALHQVVGALAVTSDRVRNYELIESIVATYSDGCVQAAEEKPPVKRDGVWNVECRYRVRFGALRTALSRAQRKQVDARDMDPTQAATELGWDEHQQRESAVIAAKVFSDYPWALLDMQCDRPRRGPSDRASIVFEVGVRVSVNAERWADWMHQATRVLGPLSEDRGEVAWSIRQPGHLFLRDDGSDPVDRDSGWYTDESRAGDFRRVEQLREIVPERERAGAVFYIRETPGQFAERKLELPNSLSSPRVVAIHDPMAGTVRWWQLRPAAWDAIQPMLSRLAALEMRLVDEAGRDIGEPVRDWWSDSIGPYTIQHVGWPELSAQLGEGANVRFRAAWDLGPMQRGPQSGRLILPFATLELACSKGTAFGFAPVTVFRYRFRVDRSTVTNLPSQPKPVAEWVKN